MSKAKITVKVWSNPGLIDTLQVGTTIIPLEGTLARRIIKALTKYSPKPKLPHYGSVQTPNKWLNGHKALPACHDTGCWCHTDKE